MDDGYDTFRGRMAVRLRLFADSANSIYCDLDCDDVARQGDRGFFRDLTLIDCDDIRGVLDRFRRIDVLDGGIDFTLRDSSDARAFFCFCRGAAFEDLAIEAFYDGYLSFFTSSLRYFIRVTFDVDRHVFTIRRADANRFTRLNCVDRYCDRGVFCVLG